MGVANTTRHSSHNLSTPNTLEFYRKPTDFVLLSDAEYTHASDEPLNGGGENDDQRDRRVADILTSTAAKFSKSPMERWLTENQHPDDDSTNEKGLVPHFHTQHTHKLIAHIYTSDGLHIGIFFCKVKLNVFDHC